MEGKTRTAWFGFTNLTGHDGRQALLLVHQHEVLQRPRLEEEGVSLLQRHRRGELGFFVVVPQVGDLVKVTDRTTRWYRPTKGLGGPPGAQPQVQKRHTHWFPNSEATNKKPVFRTHMAVATGMVSKYFSRISVTFEEKQEFPSVAGAGSRKGPPRGQRGLTISSSVSSVTLKMSPCSVWARKKNMDLVLWVAEQTKIIPRSGSSRSF